MEPIFGKLVITIFLSLICLSKTCFAQDKPDKEQTMNYIYDKINKYHDDITMTHGENYYDVSFTNLVYTNGSMYYDDSEERNSSYEYGSAHHVCINLNYVTNYKIENIWPIGFTYPADKKFIKIMVGNNENYIGIKWDAEPNLENRLKNAFDRLIELNSGNDGKPDPFNK